MTVEIIDDEVIQGDTGPMWQISVPSLDADGNNNGNEDLTSYTCNLVFTNSSGTEVVRSITTRNSTDTAYLVQLRSTETDAMKTGLNKVVVEVRNGASPPYVSEVQVNLTVKKQRYTP